MVGAEQKLSRMACAEPESGNVVCECAVGSRRMVMPYLSLLGNVSGSHLEGYVLVVG